jgi:hypothetical protein
VGSANTGAILRKTEEGNKKLLEINKFKAYIELPVDLKQVHG